MRSCVVAVRPQAAWCCSELLAVVVVVLVKYSSINHDKISMQVSRIIIFQSLISIPSPCIQACMPGAALTSDPHKM